MDLVDIGLLLEVDPSLDQSQAERVLAAVNGQVARVAPCLLDEAALGRAEAVLVVVGALKAFSEGPPPPWLESETTGPFTARFRAVGPRAVLSAADEAALRTLCGGVAPGTSQGSFPPAGEVGRIFGRPW